MSRARRSRFPWPHHGRWMTRQRRRRQYYARHPEERMRYALMVQRLGAALSDPTPGIARLSRVGVSFRRRGWWVLLRVRFWYWLGRPERAQRLFLRSLLKAGIDHA